MFRKITALLLSVLLLLPACVQAEDELDIEEVIDLTEEESSTYQLDSNGNTIITVTCTGDFTIGGDNYHKKGKKFYSELEKNDNNINFTIFKCFIRIFF